MMGHDVRLQDADKPTSSISSGCARPSRISAERAARHEERGEREDRPGLPAARHRDRRLHPDDHGYWSAQLLEPYVDEEWPGHPLSQALRFFPTSRGLPLSELYLKLFAPTTCRAAHPGGHRYARDHKWYMTSRLIT